MKRKASVSAKRVSPQVNPVGKPPKVDFQRNELNLLLPEYYLVRDAVGGENYVKGIVSSSTGFVAPTSASGGGVPNLFPNIVLTRATRYLPKPNPSDTSNENADRYRAYVQRAVWYGVTGRTLEGLAGQIFLRDPEVKLPTQLQILTEDADGSGLTLDQLADRAVRNCLQYGRAGLLVDYPVTNGPITQQMAETGEVRPVIICYYPWDIINWRVELIGAKKVLTMVVLREVLDEPADDGFALNSVTQYRVLKLEADATHSVQIYRSTKSEGGSTQFTPGDTFVPRDASGKPFNYIPFTFIGSENNDVTPNKPPLYDLASLNIAHYRNSADYEESCFIVGQPTPAISGLSEDWVKNILKDTITLGSRAAVPLPVGAKMELIQAAENSMPMEAMKQKEAQMVALGAKLVQPQKSTKTATQQIIETTSESSPLGHVSKNVSAAITEALGIAAEFVGASPDSVDYKLNKDFDLTSMTADDQNAVVLQWQSGAIGFSEMRTVLRRAGTATLPDDEARTAIQKDIKDGLIPDPAQSAQPAGKAPLAKAASAAGGPQPTQRANPGSPGTNA